MDIARLRHPAATVLAGVTSAVILFVWTFAHVELFGHRSRTDDPVSLALYALLWMPLAWLWTATVTMWLARAHAMGGKASLARLTVRSTLAVCGAMFLWVAFLLVGELRSSWKFVSFDLRDVATMGGYIVSIVAGAVVYWLVLEPNAVSSLDSRV